MSIAILLIIGVANGIIIKSVVEKFQKNGTDDEGLKFYDVYALKWIQFGYFLLIYGLFGGFVGYVFYRSIYAVLIFGYLFMWLVLSKRKELIQKQKDLLTVQFKDAIYIISTSLAVGKSLTNAIGEASVELGKMYLGETAYMVKELEIMFNRLSMNSSIEMVFEDFSQRAKVDDIAQFTHILIVGRKKGANINELIRKTSQVIGDKIQIQREIITLLTSKKYEFRIMTLMPVFFIAFLTKSSPDLMDPVYTEILGRIAMTVALALFGIAYVVAEKLVKIEV